MVVYLLNMKYIISESQYKKLISEDGKYIYIDRQVNSFIYEDGHKVTLYQATSDQVKDIVPKYRRRVRVLIFDNCQKIDFSGMDLCSYPKLSRVIFRKTPNNFTDVCFDCYTPTGSSGVYDVNNEEYL